ncbi:MAG: AAA family ATPase [Verrucomicrobiota bacterium]
MSIKPSAYISSLTFSGGDKVDFEKNEKVILVGPNNSGKSQTLRELISIARDGKTEHTLVVNRLELEKEGSQKDLEDFLRNEADYVNLSYRYRSWELHETHVRFWNQNFLMHGLANGFIKNIDANNRLSICQQQNSIGPADQKSMPQHVLYNDEVLMKKVSGLFRKAFGKHLIFDFRGGSKIPIHIGEEEKLEGLVDRVSDAYTSSVREFPLLDKQGDGMKSYAGILFESIVSDLDITLIDEPEAFLHPPQMRKIGETLSSEVNGQLFVSTHSSDILRGFLEGTKGEIRILRIEREGNQNYISEAPKSAIQELWTKPDLRYSNALEGIFHEQTIICEDDSDCKLFNSVSDYLANDDSSQWKDTAYVPTGGKHAIPKVAQVLREIGVPIKAVFDIDFLSEKSLVQNAVNSFGGDWEEVEGLWNRLNAEVRKGIKPKTPNKIKEEIIDILNKAEPDDLPKSDVTEAMKGTKPWNLVKKFGYRGIPNGQAQQVYNQLNSILEAIGIFMVPVGEIENFCPEMGSHGPKFVTKLLSEVPLEDERLDDLKTFVRRVHEA